MILSVAHKMSLAMIVAMLIPAENAPAPAAATGAPATVAIEGKDIDNDCIPTRAAPYDTPRMTEHI